MKDDLFLFGVGVLVGAVALSMILLTQLDELPKSEAPGLERELRQCVKVLEETQRSADFWREQALAMRTEGVDSLRPVPEGKR